MTVPTWPERGRCGACAQPALRYPSMRWCHVGEPCRARRQTVWGVDDAAMLKQLLWFVPDGVDLPPASDELRAWMRYEGGAAS